MEKLTRRTFIATAAGFGISCSTGTSLSKLGLQTAKLPRVPGTSPLALGLNACYHGPLDAETLDYLNNLGPLVLRATVATVEQGLAIAAATRPYSNLRVLWLVEGTSSDWLTAFAVGPLSSSVTYGLALMNEIDLAGWTPQAANQLTRDAYTLLRSLGYTGSIYAPSIYCVEPDHLYEYATPLWRDLPADVIADVHRYGDPNAGQNGYKDRNDEISTLRAVLGTRRVIVSEGGYVTRTPQEETEALAALQIDAQWHRALGAELFCVYQYTDGPGTGDLDHFGLRAIDGRWKAQAEFLRG